MYCSMSPGCSRRSIQKQVDVSSEPRGPKLPTYAEPHCHARISTLIPRRLPIKSLHHYPSMSTKAKLTLAGTTVGAVGIVIFVHFQQKWDKAFMHQGVIRDMDNQRIKRERQADFEIQRQLEEEYRKVQTVSDGQKG